MSPPYRDFETQTWKKGLLILMSLKYDNINVFSYVHAAFCTLGKIHYQCSLIPLMFRSRLW